MIFKFHGKIYYVKSQDLTPLPSPQRDQLQIEVMRLRDTVQKSAYDLNGRSGIMDLSEDRLIEEIDEVDVDRFTFEIWQFLASGSPLETELGIKPSS